LTAKEYATALIQINAIMQESIDAINESNINTIIDGINSWNTAMDESYLASGKMILAMNGMAADDYPGITLAIDTLNKSISSTENSSLDFTTSLISFGSIFEKPQ